MSARRAIVALAVAGFGIVAAHAGNGQRVYDRVCAVCHGADGSGAMPGVPDFTARNGPLAKPDAVLWRSTVDGTARPGAMPMPARGGNPTLTDDELRAALGYIRRAFGASTTMEKRKK